MDTDPELPKIAPVEETSTIKHFEKRISGADEFCTQVWEKALENQRFVAGGENQWDQNDYRARKDAKKPVFSMDDIALAVNNFAGKEITTRFMPTTLPRSSDDGPWSNVCRETLRMIRDRSFAEQSESDKFRDLGIDGYAFVEWSPNYLEDPLTGRLQPDGIDLWEMVWDPTSRKQCLMDREWDARGKWISIEEYLGLFPDKRDTALAQLNSPHEGWVNEAEHNITRWPWLYRTKGHYVDPRRREVFVADYQYRIKEPCYLVIVPPSEQELAANPQATARKQLFSEEDWDRLLYEWTEQGNPGTPEHLGPADGVYRWKAMRAFIAGKEVLRDGPMKIGRFNRIAMTGVPFKQAGVTLFKGFVDYMKDPQRFQNEIISLSVSYLARGPKGPLMYTAGAFDNEETAMRQLSMPLAAIKMRPNWKDKVEWGPDLPFPTALDKFMEMAERAVWRPIGSSPAAMGQVEDPRRVSGQAYSQIVSAGQQSLSIYFDSLRLYRRLSGELILAYLPTLYDETTLRDLLGPELGAAVPPKSEWSKMLQRDVIVEEVLSTKSEQEAAWDYGSRQGTWEKLLMARLMPPEIFVKMIPSSWLPEPDKKLWIDYLKQMQAAQQAGAEQGGGAPAE
jgi:hypothetical protein